MDWGKLPGEMIEEILSWVPSKSLSRFQSTSKHWQALLKSESFAKKHSANAPEEEPLNIMLIDYRVFLVKINLHDAHPSVKVAYQFNLKDPEYKSSQVVVAIRNVFHCDGLLLCTTKDKRLMVWNPCSGETKWIKPRDRYKKHDYYALGYNNNNKKQYKVLRVESQKTLLPIKNKYEIYDFTSDSWRVLGVTTDWFLAKPRRRGVSLKGNTYWVATWNHNDFLLSFDFSTEMFQSLSLPHPFPHSISALSVVRENKLCLFGTSCIYYVTRRLHVSEITCWVTNSLGSVMSWSEFLTAKVHNEVNLNGYSFLADEQNKIVVYCNQSTENNKIVHIVRGNTYINVDPLDRNSTIKPSSSSPLLLSYVPSLVQIKQGKSKACDL
ncbi:putative F-box protein At3g23260 [Raphanus sativus]|uniref:F-box protein At3g23260 n=1 Tax=Raphanus sativus TaxID=3726 RepID=A0A6J0NU55_RAPSA|nr:putative F-box protein At3g23260 [Raphanus sativus]